MTRAKLDRDDRHAIERFIKSNTQLMAPPLVPEVLLHLAAESLPIWQQTEEQLGEINVPPPFWAFAWAGGQALARHILDSTNAFSGRTVIDVGTGSGLAAIAAAKAGAAAVSAFDIDVLSTVAAQLNAEANAVLVEASTADVLGGGDGVSEIVLIGDLFYERELAERALAWAERRKAQGALVLVGDPGRSYFPAGAFERVADYRVPVTRELEDAEIKSTAVWTLR
jgi:predicted nicotinamide N-methyase